VKEGERSIAYPTLQVTVKSSITIFDDPALAGDEFAFLELYCNDENCDCRRVIFKERVDPKHFRQASSPESVIRTLSKNKNVSARGRNKQNSHQ